MNYAIAGYVLAFVVLVAYAWRVIRRGKQLTRALPPEERTW